MLNTRERKQYIREYWLKIKIFFFSENHFKIKWTKSFS